MRKGGGAGQTEKRSRATSTELKANICTAMEDHLHPDTIRQMESMVLGVCGSYWVSTRTWNMTVADTMQRTANLRRSRTSGEHYVECEGEEVAEWRNKVSRFGLDVKQVCFASALTRSPECSCVSLLTMTLA